MNSHTSWFAYAVLLMLGLGANSAQAFVADPLSTIHDRVIFSHSRRNVRPVVPERRSVHPGAALCLRAV